MFKKFTNQLIFLFIFVTLTTSASAFYSDVDETTPYFNEIKSLYENGKLPDYPDNKFHPESRVTLPELYEIVFSYTKTPISEVSEIPYADLSTDDPKAKFIKTALDLNILKPIGQTPRIYPQSALNKSATLRNLYPLFGIGVSPLFDKNDFPFIDLDKDSHLAPLANKTYELGIIESTPELFRMSKIIKKTDLIHYITTINKKKPTINIQLQPPSVNVEKTDNPDLEKFLDIWGKLKTSYYYKNSLNDNTLITGAINGLLKEVNDDYTTYKNADEAIEFFVGLGETYSGIGIVIEEINGNAIVITPLKNSPAEKAGIKPKDIIKKINNAEVTGKSIEFITSQILGPIDTPVTIEIEREGSANLTFTIKRENIKIQTVFTTEHNHLNTKSAQIEITSFGNSTAKELTQAITELKSKNITNFIIDLRNNPGGYIDSAIDIASMFTKDKLTVFNMIDSNNHKTVYKSHGTGGLEDSKIIVLINEGSASASEILTGFLKDHKLAKIIGEKSFGKGSVQELEEFHDNSFFKYTTANWTTPNGTIVNDNGIIPDITVKGDKEQLLRALTELRN